MKNIVYLIFIAIIVNGCVSLKKEINEEKIIYVVPDTVQLWFRNVIKSPNLLNKDDVYFIISSMETDNSKAYKLMLCDLDNYIFNDNYFVKNTNRYLYIDEKLYPLLSDLDQVFSVRECCNEDLLEKLNSKRKVTLSNTVFYEKAYWVIFDNKWGDIIRTSDESKGGYRTNSPNILK
ncbi:hypothetical protein [Paenimyroides aestuarii]|uniref:Lipoprotein n=1 Tax=Paenimyroides aestuarii TaxID=2968490 RepID=A0ABY5NVP9_9FLAO|nr:hypothetical protein [Paenimyroides aestuarii]UUV22661.1 hypothetical protein NPX36_06360 [Paenimyroides aestuarii]